MTGLDVFKAEAAAMDGFSVSGCAKRLPPETLADCVAESPEWMKVLILTVLVSLCGWTGLFLSGYVGPAGYLPGFAGIWLASCFVSAKGKRTKRSPEPMVLMAFDNLCETTGDIGREARKHADRIGEDMTDIQMTAIMAVADKAWEATREK